MEEGGDAYLIGGGGGGGGVLFLTGGWRYEENYGSNGPSDAAPRPVG